jgi:hypothetical protein
MDGMTTPEPERVPWWVSLALRIEALKQAERDAYTPPVGVYPAAEYTFEMGADSEALDDEETDAFWETVAPYETCPLCGVVGAHSDECPTSVIILVRIDYGSCNAGPACSQHWGHAGACTPTAACAPGTCKHFDWYPDE